MSSRRRRRWQEALAESRLASELDPLSPMIAMSEPWLAVLEGRHEVAVEGFRRLAAANSRDIMAIGGLGLALVGKGDYPAALEASSRCSAWRRPPRLSPSSDVHARLGESRRGTEDSPAIAGGVRQFVSPAVLRLLYMGLGDADNAFRYLEMAREQQESSLIFTRVDRRWDPFRNDPRYLTLLTEIGLSDEQIQKNQYHLGRSRLIHLPDHSLPPPPVRHSVAANKSFALKGEHNDKSFNLHRTASWPECSSICIASSPGQTIPTTWDEAALASMQTPLRDPARTPKHMPSGVYNRIPVLTIYKTYPVYAPGREPAGYMDRLRQLEPEIVFHPDRLHTPGLG